MTLQPQRVPKPVALAIALSLLSILFGFSMGGAFGIAESRMKKLLEDSGAEVLESAYQGDAAAMDAVVAKSWIYFQRAHLHGGGIGTAALGSIVVMTLVCRLGTVAQVSAVAFGAGALVYSQYWLWAGLLAPGLGGTSAAKESLTFMALPGAGLCLLGVLGTLYCVIRDCFVRTQED
jgi:hypothetical protein